MKLLLPVRGACLFPVLMLVSAPGGAARGADYEKDIKPLLKERCFACHGALKQKAGLRLDTVASMRAGDVLAAADGHALLLERVMTADLDERMPPEGEGAAFSEEQVALLRDWLAAGAPGPAHEAPEADPKTHWAYHPPKDSGKSLDELIAAGLARRGLQVQADVEPGLWLRRAHLDLTGLPPAAGEVRVFAAEVKAGGAAAARARVVDRLLATPQYGERWGRHFMDVWRYADWHGLGAQLRYSQKHIWHWRDWIIESLNADLGYDEMLRLMLAADEICPQDEDRLRATGFLARHYYLFNRTTWLDSVIEHTSRAFMGLTMQCVKCHDHKYDPVEQAEYYRLRAVFEPMHVRLDAVRGVTDFEKDGLPRVFDLHLDRPTWRHVRGEESNEDKSRAHEPGVPAVLSWDGDAFAPQPVALPREVSHPVLRPFVLDDHLAAARAEIEAARERLKTARTAGKGIGLATTELAAAKLKPQVLRAVYAAERKPKNLELAAKAAALNARHGELAAHMTVMKAQGAADLSSKDAKKKAAAEKTLGNARTALAKAAERAGQPGTEYALIRVSFKAQEGPDEPGNAAVQRYPETSTGRRLAFARWLTDSRHPLTARVLVNQVWLRHFGASLVEDVTDFGRRAPEPALREVLDTLAARFVAGGWSIKALHREMMLSDLYARSSSNAGADAATLAADPDNHFYWRMNTRRMESQVVRDSLLRVAGRLDLHIGGPTVDPAKNAASPRRALYFNQTALEQHGFLQGFDNANVLECYRREESVMPQQALALSNSQFSADCAEALAQRLTGLEGAAFVEEAFLTALGRPASAEELAVCLESLGVIKRAAFLHALLNHNDFITVR